MASTGPALYPGATTFPGAAVFPGQDTLPLMLVQYATDDVALSPHWIDATGLVRAVNTSRGRDSELGTVDAATGQIVLDNRTRTFDPGFNAAIRPMNRWMIREQFTGETQSILVGYAESYQQAWSLPNDATTTVSLVDEFKVLAITNLPTTSPPRNSYAEVIDTDSPTGYWAMDDPAISKAQTGSGPTFVLQTSTIVTNAGSGAIVGQEPEAYITLLQGNYLATDVLNFGDAGDVATLAEMTVECWFRTDTPATTQHLIIGPQSSPAVNTWYMTLGASLFTFTVVNSAAATVTITGGSTVVANQWYHVCGVVRAGNVYLYVNSTQVATAAFTAPFAATIDATNGKMTLGPDIGSSAQSYGFDELAFYRYGLTAAQVSSHYQAGVNRGFARGQFADARINAVLDAVTNRAPRSIRTGTRFMTGAYMTGQPPLDELRNANAAEAVDAVLYIGRDGTVVFLDAAYRTVSPWNTVQATFGDAGGAELPYQDLQLDYSDTFLTNEWNVSTPAGLPASSNTGAVQTASDSTSIGRYYKRSTSLSDVPVAVDSDASAIATAMLAKYKDPMVRVTQITLMTNTPAVSEAIFRRDIGDRVEILRTPPGGGSRIDQTVFIQKISVTATPNGPWQIVWNVSPV
jgi:hypothetical protein